MRPALSNWTQFRQWKKNSPPPRKEEKENGAKTRFEILAACYRPLKILFLTIFEKKKWSYPGFTEIPFHGKPKSDSLNSDLTNVDYDDSPKFNARF